MSTNRSSGLLAGLLTVLATVAIAAIGLGQIPAENHSKVLPDPTPTRSVGVMDPAGSDIPAPTQTPFPTQVATRTPTLPPPSQPLPSSTPTRPASPTPAPTATSSIGTEIGTEEVIGQSVQGRPIVAHRIGEGAVKIVLVGNIHGDFEANTHILAQELLAHFQAHPEEVPEEVSLWIIPTMNPDGLATGHRWNANDVDLNRNADTDLDGCAGNDWSPDTFGSEGLHPGAGGTYPFSEPESRAMRDFLDDAWMVAFYHSQAGATFVDTCQRHTPTARLAEVLSAATGYPVPAEGWTGYRITGDFGDYLAGEGVASVALELTNHEDPEFERNLEGVRALLASVDEILSVEAREAEAEFIWLDEHNTGTWHYAENSFIHPIALEVIGDTAYLLDGGRVLALALDEPAAPRLLLAPGDDVENVRVLEPLDLATDGSSLLALDRAGDVYRYDPATDIWAVERYDRPARDTYDHYFVALDATGDARFLVDTTHEQVWRFPPGQRGTAWIKLPQSRDVDLSMHGNDLYVLTRALNAPMGTLLRYQESQRASAFRPNVNLMHPRQVHATDTAVYVLDRAGRRLLTLNPDSGALLALYQFRNRQAVSAVWADRHSATLQGTRFLLAGRDTLYFYGEPDRVTTIEGGPSLKDPQPHDPALLASLRGLSMPIEGAGITTRDFQMPGASRHYRLGLHEGIDFYGHTVGVPVNRRTPVRAVADGVVLRALTDYQPLTAAQADAWAARCRNLGYTPPEVLDGYRGMQIWIDHGGGIVSRYAHLGSIEPGIAEGTSVTRGQVIGMVGNSGTPASIRSATAEVHLHLELWVGTPSAPGSGQSYFVGQFLRPIETREWLERILR